MATVWVDLDNAPHVPFFRPLIHTLEIDGHELVITFRDHGYISELLQLYDIRAIRIGRYAGESKLLKAAGLASRVVQLVRFGMEKPIDVAVSHGSRALVLACRVLNIPSVTMYDYEFVSTGLFNRLSTKVMLPDGLPDDRLRVLGLSEKKVLKYSGFKEEVYVTDFTPDGRILTDLDLDVGRVIVLLRPPATMAHYRYLAENGILGLGAILAVFVGLFRTLLQQIGKGGNQKALGASLSPDFIAGLVAGLSGFFVDLITCSALHVPLTRLTFWMLAGLSLAWVRISGNRSMG